MPDVTLTRSDLAETLYKEFGLSKSESGDLVQSMFGHIIDSLAAGETVKLAGFGVFFTRDKDERPGRNPKTGRPATIESRRVVTFRPSAKLKQRVEMKLKVRVKPQNL